jgi:hypothetical protein
MERKEQRETETAERSTFSSGECVEALADELVRPREQASPG